MGLLLLILGIIFFFLVSTALGLVCIVIGLVLMFVPGRYGRGWQ